MAKLAPTLAILATLGTWFTYLALSPHLSSAFALLPGLAYYFWRTKRPGAATAVLFGGALLVDLTLPAPSAQYLAVSAVAAAAYLWLVEPYLALSGALGNVLGLLVWLVLWRATYLCSLTATALLHHTALPTTAGTVSFGLRWLATGAAAWALAQLLALALPRARRGGQASFYAT